MLRGLFDAFVRASWSVKASDREGHLQELMTNQVTQATRAPAYATMLVTNLFAFLALIVAAVVISPEAAAIILGTATLLFALLRPLSRAGSRSARDLSAAQLEQAAGVSEATRLAEETEVFGVGDAQRQHVANLIEHVRGPRLPDTARAASRPQRVPERGLSTARRRTCHRLRGRQERSRLARTGRPPARPSRHLRELAQLSYQTVRQALPYPNRVLAAERRYAAAAPPQGMRSFDSLESLAFRDVCLLRTRSGERVLSDLNFDVSQGETIGIIGPSGAGKSTLAQLLLRLREPTEGRYLVNGIPAGDLRQSDWNLRVAFVPQTPQLIHASVADNIRYFRDVADAEVERAAQLARIDSDIRSWRAGYQTIVGPPGSRGVCRPGAADLSRAGSHAETTHSLTRRAHGCPRSDGLERLVQESLTQLKGELTLFVIAHRMSTLDICDRVMVFVQGRLDAFEPFTSLRGKERVLSRCDRCVSLIAHAAHRRARG